MNLKSTSIFYVNFLTLIQFTTFIQSSHVQEAKHRIRAEVRNALGTPPQSNHHNRQRHHYHHLNDHQPFYPRPHHHYNHHDSHWQNGARVHRLHTHRNRWSGRRGLIEHQHFTSWTAWTACSDECVKRRERHCKLKRKCGFTKHIEERKCKGCHYHANVVRHYDGFPPQLQLQPQPIIINAAAAAASGAQQQHPLPAQTVTPAVSGIHQSHYPTWQEIPNGHNTQHLENIYHDDTVVANSPQHRNQSHQHATDLEEDEEEYDQSDFYVLNDEQHRNNDEFDALASFEAEAAITKIGTIQPIRTGKQQHQYHHKKHSVRERHYHQHNQNDNRGHHSHHSSSDIKSRNLDYGDNNNDGIEGDTFQYDDFDFDQTDVDSSDKSTDNQYIDLYEDSNDDGTGWKNTTSSQLLAKEKATPDDMVPRHRRIYSKWSRWTKCSPKCTTRRYKKCRVREQCGREVLREIAYCYTEGSFCQQWLQAQVQKLPAYNMRPIAASRRRGISDDTQSNAIGSNDYIMNGRGYRGPEYTPLKLKCGIAPIRRNKRNMYNMLKIIGGKAARKGEWPWQVAIFNRFKEAFCGGTLIAPQWVLTAAHCVRKVLYVRFGEHNLDYEDGTELQLRVLRSYKHPNFDKKTVDSDVALLRLPKPVNATTWIGLSCLPRPFQPLPRNVDCTVIGWGKRRSRDMAGTSVLHQADVPIIPMENCRSVYYDYTITKNMFCAGHKRGRVDTCAGDSGGPLLCRDTTKPNHPWTIFGITSFGDGCAKRNKFGIYAKVPNYVDWVWSVINCNGNCKLHQRM